MEYLNRVELTGKVGNVRITEVGAIRVARVAVATEYNYKNVLGEHTIETTWHNVVINGRSDGPDNFEDIVKGASISVKGRIKMTKYINSLGIEGAVPEIVAYSWSIIDAPAI